MRNRCTLLAHQGLDALLVDAEFGKRRFGKTERAFGFGHQSIAGTGTAKGADVAQPPGAHDDTKIRLMR